MSLGDALLINHKIQSVGLIFWTKSSKQMLYLTLTNFHWVDYEPYILYTSIITANSWKIIIILFYFHCELPRSNLFKFA